MERSHLEARRYRRRHSLVRNMRSSGLSGDGRPARVGEDMAVKREEYFDVCSWVRAAGGGGGRHSGSGEGKGVSFLPVERSRG